MSFRVPVASMACPPVLWTCAATINWPRADRVPLIEVMSKFTGDGPPGPTFRYIRMPTRLVSMMLTPLLVFPRLVSCAQITP